ncbi:MAG TPA: gamma carbonic anhydrase family protein [Candidatus Polarisedimenticolia bacterium]|jgi:carbonic anhydrase/acetyltransferase-like protein (isoleucine patch superfamily)|nr:gamma carbonic anhydrase family protein [Candidatus Polarisedimenticolia bacterium]
MATYRATKLQIDATAFVAPGAALVGEVTVGRDASIWFQATLRGDMEPITIGAESNVQDACVVHVDRGRPTVIGDRVTLGHGAIVHASIVEDDVLVAMKAVILSGCHIGRNCLVGAGAVVPEETRVPEGSLVLGVPGRVVRALRAEEIDRIHRNARAYVDLSRAYRDGVIRVPREGGA